MRRTAVGVSVRLVTALKLLLVGASAIMLSCYDPGFYLTIQNGTGVQLSDVSIEWPGFAFPFGYEGLSQPKTYAGVTGSCPATAVVRWRTPDGVLHGRSVEIREKLGGCGDGVWLTIRGNGQVEVKRGR